MMNVYGVMAFIIVFGSSESMSSSSSDESLFNPSKFFEKFPPWFNNEENFFNSNKFFEKIPSFLKPIDEFNVTLLLMTSSRSRGEQINLPLQKLPQSLKHVNFKKEIVFIIHGFMSHGRVYWMFDLAKAYIRRKDVNVFLVDWGSGALMLNYASAVKNTKKTAKLLIGFIDFLMRTKDLSPLDIHIIGHSLGAHVSGFIGKAIPGIHRITGLDPAQPLFTDSKNATMTRLHRDDAIFVDVIHTNAFFLGCGLPESIGDVDFYINGGKTQPGCPLNMMNSSYYMKPISIANIRIDGFLTKIGCSHLRAIEYFVESIKVTDCVFIGRRNTTKLQKRSSSHSMNNTSVLGLYTFNYPARGDFHIETNSKSPYCIKQLK